jgi:hypothetical protein
MPDPREWISRIKAESPPELWPAVMERASAAPAPSAERVRAGRPSTPRRAAFVTGVAAGILALTLVVAVLRGGPPGDGPPTPTPEPTGLDGVHRRLERALSQLWIAETNVALLRGEVEGAQDRLSKTIKAAGATPTNTEQQQIEAAQQSVEANMSSLQAARAKVEQLRPGVEQLREVRAGLLPPPDAAAYPDLVTVLCGGDGHGGTHVSTPVVRARADGTHVRVVNQFGNEFAYFVVNDEVVHEVRPATTADVVSPAGNTTADVVLPSRPSGDVQIVCTYDEPPFNFPRPSHPLWIAAAGDGLVSESPSPPVTALDPFTLTASLDGEPVVWPEVAFIPAGEADDQIGYSRCSDCVLPVPSALAVDRDGSYWIADGLKARIAHFARDGSFIEAFPAKIGSALPVAEHAADLAFVGDRLYVLLEEGASRIAPVGANGLGEPLVVNHEGRRLDVEALILGQDELLVLVSGAEELLGGFWAYATVHPATGQITPAPGVQDSVGSYIDIQPDFDASPGTFEIRWSRDGQGLTTVQEVRFQLVRGGQDGRTTVGDMYVRTSTQWGVATVVSIGDGQGTPVGKWYLEILPESPSFTFERLPDEGFIGNARRYLTAGPDGRVYWMRLLEDGLHIYRR